MNNKEYFNKVLNSFQDEYTLYCRNTISKDSVRLQSELKRNDSYDINGIAIIIAKIKGEYIQEQGDKAIEIFVNFLNAYKSPPLEKELVDIILDRVRKSLDSTAQFARIYIMQKAASKGMERQLNLKSYQIEKELGERINPILEKMRIEINKYNILSENSLNSSASKTKLSYKSTLRWIIFLILLALMTIVIWSGFINIDLIDKNPNFNYIMILLNIAVLLLLLIIFEWKHWVQLLIGAIGCVIVIIGILKI